MSDSKKNKTQLIAELEATRSRLRVLEGRPVGERRHNYLLRIFIDALPHFAFAFDEAGRILQVITGDNASEALVLEGKLLIDVIPQVDAEGLMGALRKTFDSGEPQRLEFVLSVLAGRRWYEVKTALANESHDGEPSVVFLFQDVTNEKLAEGVLHYTQIELAEKTAALGESDKRFSNLIDNSLQGIYVHDGKRIVYVNQNFARLFGFASTGEVLEHGNITCFCAPAERNRLSGYLREQFSGGNPPDRYEYQGQRKDGSLIWLENLGQMVNWNKEQAILVTVLDIAERKRVEDELRAGERLLHTLFDSIPHAMFMRDIEGRYLMVNEILASRYGLTPADFAGRRIEEIVSDLGLERDWNAYLESDRTVFETGEKLSLPDRQILMNDGSTRTVHTVKSPVRDESGKVVGVVGVTEDISERKQMEERLRMAQKMEAVGQLAGGIAHDFNNLLQVINNYARFARGNLERKDDLPEWIDRIIRAADRASSLTRQMLAFSRKSSLQQEAVDLNALTAQFLNMVERVIGEDIELSFRPASGLHTVFADKGMMEQVILNLCVNARDAMPGGGSLEIETENFVADAEYCRIHNWESPGDYVVLTVRDNGCGMTRETSDHIFEPFFTTKDVGQGTGLGLAMLHGIVEQHAGKIEVSSEPDEGTTFRIYLPRSDVEITDSEQLHLSEAAGGSESILVVEDEEAVRNLLAQLLDSKGYRVLTADDGMQAIEQLESGAESIDLVILDVVMPKVRGKQVYDYIQKNHSGLPVIFSTGYSDLVLGPEFWDSSKLVLIQKPYSPSVLFTTVRKSLGEAL